MVKKNEGSRVEGAGVASDGYSLVDDLRDAADYLRSLDAEFMPDPAMLASCGDAIGRALVVLAQRDALLASLKAIRFLSGRVWGIAAAAIVSVEPAEREKESK